jgi:hypothetical protein
MIVQSFKEIRRGDFQHPRQMVQTARTDAIPVGFVFLDLLVAQARIPA